MAFELPPLPFAPTALEPYYDARTIEIHHGKHHAAYTTNFNKALEGQKALLAKPAEDILRNLEAVPQTIRQAVILTDLLWSLVTLELWCRMFLDGVSAADLAAELADVARAAPGRVAS